MKHIEVFADNRTLAFCAFCGGETSTGDHCPSRVFLDEPYPEHLPRVPACRSCNESFSLDEEYLACLLACIIAGSTDPLDIGRPKIRRILEKKPALVARLAAARLSGGKYVAFRTEYDRIHNVVMKLARGHAVYELHELRLSESTSIIVQPLPATGSEERRSFETPICPAVFPEVGSRAMQRMLLVDDLPVHDWVVVQPGNYRYLAEVGSAISVRIVIHEYLSCRIEWSLV
jgi:hypothetical protein